MEPPATPPEPVRSPPPQESLPPMTPQQQQEPEPEPEPEQLSDVELELEPEQLSDVDLVLAKAIEHLSTATGQADPSDAKAHYQGALSMFEAALA